MVIIIGFFLLLLIICALVTVIWSKKAGQNLFGCVMTILGVLVVGVCILLSRLSNESSAKTPATNYGYSNSYPVAPTASTYAPTSNPKIGITPEPINDTNARALGLPIGIGTYVAEVFSGSMAEVAGIQRGDFILSADGQPLYGSEGLNIHNTGKSPGDVIVLRIARGQYVFDQKVTLGNP